MRHQQPLMALLAATVLISTGAPGAEAEDDLLVTGAASAPVTESQLENARAMGVHETSRYTIENANDLNGGVSDNRVTGSRTGENTISRDSIRDIQGFATVIQNSGNNVLIQNSTVVNVTLTE